jgi:hypothetical protein
MLNEILGVLGASAVKGFCFDFWMNSSAYFVSSVVLVGLRLPIEAERRIPLLQRPESHQRSDLVAGIEALAVLGDD